MPVVSPAVGDTSGLTVRTTDVSSAQILGLLAAPVTLVAAPGAGKVIVPQFAVVHLAFGTTAYTDVPNGANPVIVVGTSGVSVQAYNALLASASSIILQPFSALAATAYLDTDTVNKALTFSNIGTNDLAAGDGTAKLVTYYTVLTVP